MGIWLSTMKAKMANDKKGNQEEAAEALHIIQELVRSTKHQSLRESCEKYDFLDIPAISKICCFGWAECPISPTPETIAPILKRRISKFSRGRVAEGIYNLAQHAISELLSRSDGSFQSRTYTALNHDGYGGVTRLDIFFFVYRFTSKTLRSKASPVIACEVLESATKDDRLNESAQSTAIFMTVNLTTQKRLAAAVVGCGKRKIWLDPNEVNEISNANSRQTIRKLVSDGLIIRKPVAMHSRARARELNAARRMGRHRGFGKRKGTKDARMPSQVLWMRRLRVLRRLLVKYRAAGKIDKHLYHELYHLSKGNTFKHKRALVEHIHKAKAEAARERALKEEMDAKRAKTKAARERRQERIQTKRNALAGEDEPAAKE
ncbi:hypothetical protein EPUS_08658 [Endocarpon pusillum Z07020]|uniref:Ribosomal protein L19 n=1 Tax=Endocarpon pusillum (strain Z07020 / HMAS-L-300199) TaxID=1263415 RepID=U1G968_ENDPU|nr:uncharacterized protein EPUS_08658 [Endocarpon pusillum Z07020]ERF68221.1 hypothetical protein EPUS_08658 [Endocarpon pusillum Z07020]